MKKHTYLLIAATLLITNIPHTVRAAALPDAPILITEVQMGTEQSGSQEFIELFNQSSSVIDLTSQKWELQIASSRATDWTKAKKVDLTGTFYPGTYYLLTSTYTVPGETKSYLQDHASSTFSPGMSATSGHVRVARNSTEPIDSVEWSTAKDDIPTSPAIESSPIFILSEAVAAGQSIKRKLSSTHQFITGRDAFMMSSCPSPTATNTLSFATTVTSETLLPLVTTIDIDNPACLSDEEPAAEDPIVQSPTEPPVTLLPAFISPDVVEEQTQKRIPVADQGLLAPQLTELLPNPASPQTDAADEFIELYNPNDVTYDLSGFMLYAGTTSSKKYTFIEGTLLPPRGFKAFFTAETHLSLSNSGGQVRLTDPLDREIATSNTYVTAKDGQSWARVNGTWQWTAKPTPGTANVLQAPPPAATKKASTSTGVKKTTNTAKTPTSRTATKPAPAAQTVATVAKESPVHPWVLAGVGGLALLYGAYEYRRDVANKFYQLRSNRAARRADRTRIEGR